MKFCMSLAKVSRHAYTAARGVGHGLDRDSGVRTAGAERLQRAFRVYLLSPTSAVQTRGDCLAAKLRPDNVHSADGWEEVLPPEIERQQQRGKEVVFRADAAFAKPEIYKALEARNVNSRSASRPTTVCWGTSRSC